MQNLTLQNNLVSFPTLTNLGVKNFFTYGNEYWGSMRIFSNPDSIEKYKEIFETQSIRTNFPIYIGAENNDGVRLIDEENYEVYKNFTTLSDDSDLTFVKISTDGIVTKLKVPILIAPADCAIIVITAVDSKDQKRFIIHLHAGLTGTYLHIYKKGLQIAHDNYEFSDKDLDIFVFPHLSSPNYIKSEKDTRVQTLLKKSEWNNFLKRVDDKNYLIDFSGYLIHDLKKISQKVYLSGLDCYEENKLGNLFSQTYLKNNNENPDQRFLVGVQLV